ncbi:GDP-fucose synthetase [Candidatus Pacearchaeota archaeon CG_4_9_14_0_2_um_filter_39_13]|nr:GDP-L-fucose synthase [Candidatus Pacearchaeota archaeon]OIO43201.1 MAG: GDP-fucose synthetase [Candidatus Pacearchaeota archaeon CG1_02_39_14]PJC44896.1 MAG: GDP-fucose synthetase [Candidatus Pacearchaeota archaeon CG_4_9_14_0_2_um_filter_39_13]
MKEDEKVYVAGHTGLVGSAIVRALKERGFRNLALVPHGQIDLCDQRATKDFFASEKPDYVFFAAGRVGGLQANNTRRAEFITDNIQMQTNVLVSAWKTGVKKLLYLGSNCAYPKECEQPMNEEALFTGRLEPTNQPFAVAKLAGIEMCNAFSRQYGARFISVIPASLFGPRDNYGLVNSHIVPTLIRRCHEAKKEDLESISISGSRERRRELLYVDDLAQACLFLMDTYESPDPINVGTGRDYSVGEIAEVVRQTVGYKGRVFFDITKPSGMMRKLLDSSKIKGLGWQPRVSLEEGMVLAYEGFLSQISEKN